MIISLELQRLRNGEYAQLLQDILQIVEQADPAALQVSARYAALKSLAGDIEMLFKVPTGSAVTQELEQYDLLRDNALYGIQSIVNGYRYSPDPLLKKHAGILSAHLAVFGSNIPQNSYQGETASIRNIIADWKAKPELSAAITALHLDPWKDALDDANANFSSSYIKRAQESGAANTDKLKAKRIQANNAYYALRDMLNAYFVINKDDGPYEKVIAEMNGLLTNYNDLLARRKAGDGNAAPEVNK